MIESWLAKVIKFCPFGLIRRVHTANVLQRWGKKSEAGQIHERMHAAQTFFFKTSFPPFEKSFLPLFLPFPTISKAVASLPLITTVQKLLWQVLLNVQIAGDEQSGKDQNHLVG